jgi:hypothetical protein
MDRSWIRYPAQPAPQTQASPVAPPPTAPGAPSPKSLRASLIAYEGIVITTVPFHLPG